MHSAYSVQYSVGSYTAVAKLLYVAFELLDVACCMHGSQHSDPKRVTAAVMMKDGSNAGSQGDAVARLHAGLA